MRRIPVLLPVGIYETADDISAPAKGEDYAAEGMLTLAKIIGMEYDDPQ